MTGTSGQQRPAGTRTSLSYRTGAGEVCPGPHLQSPPSGAGSRQALLPHHPRSVQTLNNDPAVGFSQPRCQDVQVMSTNIVDPAM